MPLLKDGIPTIGTRRAGALELMERAEFVVDLGLGVRTQIDEDAAAEDFVAMCDLYFSADSTGFSAADLELYTDELMDFIKELRANCGITAKPDPAAKANLLLQPNQRTIRRIARKSKNGD